MTKKRILPPDRLAECEAAHALFLARKNELKLTQKKIADEAGMTPAAVNLYFKGLNPLNAKFAAVLARLLGVPVEKFSPRLADEIRGLRSAPAADTDHRAGAAEKVMAMLRMHAGKKLDDAAQQKIASAVADSLVDEPKTNVIPADFSGLKVKKDEIFIPQYDIRASMGHGQIPPDYTEAIRNVIVKESVLQEKGVTYTSPSALAMIFGWGQSMEGTINDKDPLIVDRGVNEFVGEGIYVLTWHNFLYIKRLQFLDEEHFWLISDNEKHKDQQARIEDVTIHAKVLLIWNAKKA